MRDLDAVEATRRITTDPTSGDVKVLVLTPSETDELVLAVVRGRHAFAHRAGAHPAGRPGAAELPGFDDLNDQEREITVLVAAGLSNTEIARRLLISPATAKTHVNRAMAKTGARDHAQPVVLACEAGLAAPFTA